MHQINLSTLDATKDLAARIAKCLRVGDIVALKGPLGAGKTTLARYIIQGLGWMESEIPSPTFTLAQEYDFSKFTLWHFDMYRLEAPEDALEIGVEEAFATGVSLIEWPERLGGYLPLQRLDVTLSFRNDAGRDDEGARQVELNVESAWADRVDQLCNG
ncbi:MAG: tRNA (adenosine(37)-N6)-threonylcarbamoyltransferase complex ATPase subunit type 1 TsaE [Alphaproteobacteria bacterium]|nr:tRNA (adenosine(37)-N6)-threonylcarbamoyltransferase complex ATPase subunit type 1 TsaE [Alphaproteobacteria bacterium]